ncbi:MAG: hypothetical protein AAF449_03145, partial [Myxococcota bacterium]
VAFDSGEMLAVRSCRLIGRPLEQAPPEDSIVGRLPLVWIQATSVTIEDNEIDASERGPSPALQAVGGVRIAGRSENVRLERNRITGGKGNGITLGSVTTAVVTEEQPGWFFGFGIWYYYWDGNCLKRGWLPGGIGIPGTPEQVQLQSEGIVTAVQIVDNDILQMAGDGIGVAWIFDDADGDGLPDDVILTVGLRIVGNLIDTCCEGEFDEISDFVEAAATHGPIALADVHDLIVRENRLYQCGATRDEALTAVSAWLVNGALIEGNQGSGNGSATAAPNNQFVGGVGLRFAAPSLGLGREPTGPSALVLHGNRLECPQGHPVAVAGLGAMSVQHNILSSTLGPSAVSPFIGSGLLIFNGTSDGPLSDDDPDNPRTETRAFGSNLVQVQNNQVNLRAQEARRSPFVFSIHNMLSSGTLIAQQNTFFMEGGPFFITDLLAFGLMSQVQNNQFTESGAFGLFSAANAGLLGTLDHNMGMFCFLLYSVFPLPAAPSEGHQNRSLLDSFSTRSEFCSRIITQLGASDGGSSAGENAGGNFNPIFGSYDLALSEVTDNTRRGKGVKMKPDLFGYATYDSNRAPRYVQAATLQQSYLSAAHLGQGAGLLAVQRKVIEREAVHTTDPEVALRYNRAAKDVHAQALSAREAVFEHVATVRAKPTPGSGGISLRGKIRRDDGSTVTGGKVSLVDAKSQVVATAAIDDSGWYALRSKTTGAGLRLQVTDANSAVVATRNLSEITKGSMLVRNIRLDQRVPTGGGKTRRDPDEIKRLEARLNQLREARRQQDAQVSGARLALEEADRTLIALEKEREAAVQKMVEVSETIEPDDQGKTFRGDFRTATREARRLRIQVRDLDARISTQRQRKTELAEKLTALEASAEALLLEQEGVQARLREDS